MLTVALTVGSVGCTSFRGTSPRQSQAVSQRSDILAFEEQIQKLSGQMENIQQQIDSLWTDIENSKQNAALANRNLEERINISIADMGREINALEAARVADRKEIISKVTETVTKLTNKMNRNVQRNPPISEDGVIHRVAAGETLSEIAAAYKVSTKILIRANKLKNPDALKVGQEIFIPE